MRKEFLIGFVFFLISSCGLFSSESTQEELMYRSPESRYALAMPTQDIVDELYMKILEIERSKNDKEKIREISEDILFYVKVLEHKCEDIPSYCID